MKIYIVECSSGSWDSYHWRVSYITLDQSKAIQERDRLNLEWEAKKLIPCQFPVDEDGDLIDEENYSEEDRIIYLDWWNINHEAKEWRPATVKEYELDKIITKWND